MGDTAKWLRALRNQKKELQAELDQVRQEYEAKLLVERERGEWLSEKLIEVQRQCRLLTYEIERKEVVISGLQADLRGTPQFRRSVKKTEAVAESVPSSAGWGGWDLSKHNITV